MADEETTQEVAQGLDEVRSTLEFLKARMLSGEEVDEKELTMLARMVATQMEELRSRLEEAVGPISPEHLREEMQKRLSPEEYAEWLEGEEERAAFRAEVKREHGLIEQLGEPTEEDANG